MTGLIDILPTVADLLGANWAARDDLELRGKSLVKEDTHEVLYAENRGPSLRAVLSDTEKLIQHLSEGGRVVSEEFHKLDATALESAATLVTESVSEDSMAELRAFASAIYDGALTGKEITVDEGRWTSFAPSAMSNSVPGVFEGGSAISVLNSRSGRLRLLETGTILDAEPFPASSARQAVVERDELERVRVAFGRGEGSGQLKRIGCTKRVRAK